MRVYISVDIEGVACVTNSEQGKGEGNEYQMARRWMTAEANAAIQGAMEAGADYVVVADSHGSMYNMIPDELHESALLVRGSPRPLTMMEGIDGTFDAAIFVGYHSMAGTPTGILAHTYLGRTVQGIRLNGRPVGEPGFNAALAGHFGVPVALVCGDDTVDAEVGALMPWCERVITKWAISPTAGRSLTPAAAQKAIRAAARRALGRISDLKPLIVEKPVRFEADLAFPIHAFIASDIPGVERIAGRTVAYTGATMLDVARIWRLIVNIALGERFV